MIVDVSSIILIKLKDGINWYQKRKSHNKWVIEHLKNQNLKCKYKSEYGHSKDPTLFAINDVIRETQGKKIYKIKCLKLLGAMSVMLTLGQFADKYIQKILFINLCIQK